MIHSQISVRNSDPQISLFRRNCSMGRQGVFSVQPHVYSARFRRSRTEFLEPGERRDPVRRGRGEAGRDHRPGCGEVHPDADAEGLVEHVCRAVQICSDHQCRWRHPERSDPARLGENHFWLSLADSDILLWAQGVAVHSGMDVTVREPDVSPLQLQGPKSGAVMKALFGESIMDLRYYWLREVELDGIPLIVSRTGWSSELGYELYFRDGSRGDALWERIMAAGVPLGLKPGHTSTIRRIEGGMLSYHADADINTNPFELGLDRLVNLEMEMDFIGKFALQRIRRKRGHAQAGRPAPRRRAARGAEYHVLERHAVTAFLSGKSHLPSIRRGSSRTSRWPWCRSNVPSLGQRWRS